MSAFRTLVPKILTLALTLSAGLALATPVYRYEALRYGDTAAPVDINDLGQIVWTGFCDSGCRARVDDNILTPLPGGYGTAASEINNAGDVLGLSYFYGPRGGIPTLWIAGVPYDLTDPANAGLMFVADAGPKHTSFDLLAVQVLNLPVGFLPEVCPDCVGGAGPSPWRPSRSALTNARGDLVFGYQRVDSVWDSFAILQEVPEPASVALVLTALLAAALASTARPRRVEPGT